MENVWNSLNYWKYENNNWWCLNVHIFWNNCYIIFNIIVNVFSVSVNSHTYPYFWNRINIKDETQFWKSQKSQKRQLENLEKSQSY